MKAEGDLWVVIVLGGGYRESWLKRSLSFVFLFVAAFTSTLLSQTTYWVAADRGPGGAGSQLDPFSSVTKALDSVDGDSGCTIYVAGANDPYSAKETYPLVLPAGTSIRYWDASFSPDPTTVLGYEMLNSTWNSCLTPNSNYPAFHANIVHTVLDYYWTDWRWCGGIMQSVGSSIVNAGLLMTTPNSTQDYRGLPRPDALFWAKDMGAFELQEIQ